MAGSSALVDTCHALGAIAAAGGVVAVVVGVLGGAAVVAAGGVLVAARVGGFGAGASSHPITHAAAASMNTGASLHWRRTKTNDVRAVHFIANL